MRPRHLAFRLALVLLALSALHAQSPSQALRMQQVVSRFVVQTGQSVVGIGSWISGKGFSAATSDFDMRLVITEHRGELQYLQQWKNAKARLVQLIEQEFGSEAPAVLRRANLYAPNQLMAGVENLDDAVERFQRLNTVPRLSHATQVIGGETPTTLMEGIYGEGSRVNLQSYERAAGRVFYYNNGKCVTGLSELVHLGEESETYTAAGTANTAGQWAEHCLAEIKAGRGDKVAKYLERLERDLVKSRSMSQLPADPVLREELLRLRSALKENPARLFDYSDRIARVVARSQTEAAILRSYANAGALRRAYLRVMLDGVAAQNAVGAQLDRLRQYASGWADLRGGLDALVFVLGTQATAQAAGRGDALESLSTAASYLKWINQFGPFLLTELSAEVLREAEKGGYSLTASTQGPWSLMQGIYTAWGRAGVDPDKRRTLTLADLVANVQYESKLEALVLAQAVRASTRGLGTASEAADMGVAQSIFNQCWPTIRDAWRWERDALATEFLALADAIPMTPLVVHYTPADVPAGTQVAFEASSVDGKLGERITRMREIIHILYGPGSGVASNFYWSPYGEGPAETGWKRTMSFGERGVHPVAARLEVAPFTSNTEADKRLLERREVSAIVEVEVEGGKKAAPAGSGVDAAEKRTEGIGGYVSFGYGEAQAKPYQVDLTLYAHVTIQAAGLARNDLLMEGKALPWHAAYELRPGVPVRVKVSYDAYVQPEKLTVRREEDGRTDYCHISFSKPAVSLVVTTANIVSGGPALEKRIDGGSYEVEFTPKYGDAFNLTASMLSIRTDNYTGGYWGPKTESERIDRPIFAIVDLVCR